MNSVTYVLLIDGEFRRTYIKRSRAEKEAHWYVERGYKAEIGEMSVVNITVVKGRNE